METFPPVTARVLHVTCKDFADDLSEIKLFYLYRGELVANPEIYYNTKFGDPELKIEQLAFKRTILTYNGRSYPFYIDKDNFDFVVPIINGMIEERVRKGKEEYEWKLKQRENELEDRTKRLNAIEREFLEEKRWHEETIKFADAIMQTRTYRFVNMLKNIRYAIENFGDKLKNINKYRIRIERKDTEE